ncbi:MAG TPA: GNAT family N-acetyltransferase [Steroidobacteraceae bacterium]|nr:GNAT family N-acetyltransferase [Steroidobacteraceae bacterium]
MLALAEPAVPADWALARALIEQYSAGLGVDLGFQDLARELAELEREYGPPAGALLLARGDAGVAGCVALRRLSPGIGELKRLYVVPGARGGGTGRRLVEAMLARARALGCARVRLDTLATMQAAQALYRSLGFRPIAPYRHNPLPGTAYFELQLDGDGHAERQLPV